MLGELPFGGTVLLELEDCALFVSEELLGGASSWFEVTFVFDLDRYIVAAVNASNPVKVTAAMIFFVFLYISFTYTQLKVRIEYFSFLAELRMISSTAIDDIIY
ncbi:hypothetical protein, partial [Sharpea azabuensis]|uniref:hypothetical protein n=1 Tax=Sharpea azabuensis TaxID=322505 RepID=UPI0015684557